MGMIIDAVEDEALLNKVLRVRHSSSNDALFILSEYDHMDTLKWFLTEVVPNDHPCLYSQCSHSVKTVFMELVKRGRIDLAEKLLAKVTDTKNKLQLLNAKTLRGREG